MPRKTAARRVARMPSTVVRCGHCRKRHDTDLWHSPWCPTCQLHVRTCERVRPAIHVGLNIADCGRHEQLALPMLWMRRTINRDATKRGKVGELLAIAGGEQ